MLGNCLLLIYKCNHYGWDVVETPPDVQFREVFGTSELCDEFWNEGQWVLILHSHGIEHPIL